MKKVEKSRIWSISFCITEKVELYSMILVRQIQHVTILLSLLSLLLLLKTLYFVISENYYQYYHIFLLHMLTVVGIDNIGIILFWARIG